MPRPLRIHVDGALHYVTARAIAPLLLFKDQKDYEAYLDLLQEYRQKLGFKLYGYVLFSDHLNLCLEPSNETTISAIMHALSSRYTKHFNRRHRHAGHLFQERFKSTLVEKAPSLLRLTAFLHLYPLRMGAVGDLAEYQWTSYAEYQAAGSGSQGDAAEVLEQLTRAYPGLTYAQYVMSMTEPEWQQLHEELQQRVLGSPSFIALVEQRLKAPSKPVTDEPRAIAAAPRVARRAPAPALERHSAMILNGTFALAFVSLCAVVLYAKNLESLRQTVRTLVNERMTIAAFTGDRSPGPAARLASYLRPATLNGARLKVELRATSGVGQSQQDQLEFQRGQLVSQALKAQGFSSSRYAMTTQPDGTVRWEAIQASPSGETAHWHGEWDGQSVRGVVTRQKVGGPAVEFNFVGAADTDLDSTREI